MYVLLVKSLALIFKSVPGGLTPSIGRVTATRHSLNHTAYPPVPPSSCFLSSRRCTPTHTFACSLRQTHKEEKNTPLFIYSFIPKLGTVPLACTDPISMSLRILWTEEPGGLQSTGLQSVGQD